VDYLNMTTPASLASQFPHITIVFRILAVVAALASLGLAKEIAPDERKSRELYQSGAMM
jgi:hypothetical protein